MFLPDNGPAIVISRHHSNKFKIVDGNHDHLWLSNDTLTMTHSQWVIDRQRDHMFHCYFTFILSLTSFQVRSLPPIFFKSQKISKFSQSMVPFDHFSRIWSFLNFVYTLSCQNSKILNAHPKIIKWELTKMARISVKANFYFQKSYFTVRFVPYRRQSRPTGDVICCYVMIT